MPYILLSSEGGGAIGPDAWQSVLSAMTAQISVTTVVAVLAAVVTAGIGDEGNRRNCNIPGHFVFPNAERREDCRDCESDFPGMRPALPGAGTDAGCLV